MSDRPPVCRLCGGTTFFRFKATLLRRIEVAYFHCNACHSMQTEEPYWLAEAYSDTRNILDVGRVQRTQLVAMLEAHILGRLGLGWNDKGLDWGGAEGLLCRMLRDRGFPFHTYDIYTDAVYTIPYRIDDPAALAPVVTTAIEVLEHLPDPLAELTAICASRPRYLLFTTEIYGGEGSDWTYLAPVNGRHVFFYSVQAMEWIGAHFGYRYFRFPFLHVFAAEEVWQRPEYAAECAALAHLWERRDVLFADAAASLTAHLTGPDLWRHVGTDFQELRRQFGGPA